jgi:hypothetical protein
MYTLHVYKADKRCKSGKRLIESIPYPRASGNSMMDEVKYLRLSKYPLEDGYILVW